MIYKMNSNLNTYMNVKYEVIRSWAKSNRKDAAFTHLKGIYKDSINSTRRIEYLDSASDLLIILEKRGCLSCDNLQPLKDLSNQLENSSVLLSRIEDYERSLLNSNNNNQQNSYVVPVNTVFNKVSEKARPNQNDFSKKQLQVYKILSMEIGQSWKNIARQLSINESSIDNIEYTHGNDLKSKISSLLALFESKTETDVWTETLCRALEKSRRKDLRYRVEDVMNGSIK